MNLYDKMMKLKIADGRNAVDAVIDASNITDMCSATEKKITGSDFPNLAPPFYTSFILGHLNGLEHGISCIYSDHHTIASCDCPECSIVDESSESNRITYRWKLGVELFISFGNHIFPVHRDLFAVREDGSSVPVGYAVSAPFLDLMRRSIAQYARLPDDELERCLHDDYGVYALSCLLAISFMHCKNVTMTKHAPDPAPHKKYRKRRTPYVSYYTLEIEPMKNVLRTEGGMDSGNSLQKALHICRGHFSTYTEERPLFGKIAGTFYIPQHVRGSAEVGINIKDYRVKV